MFVAMNRFKVKLGEEETFETVWKARETFLHGVPGFHVFNLLKGPERGDHLLYVSHSIWADREAFEDWIKSAAFRGFRRGTADTRPRRRTAEEDVTRAQDL